MRARRAHVSLVAPFTLGAAALLALGAFGLANRSAAAPAEAPGDAQAVGPHPVLPAPYATSSAVAFSKVIGWPAGRTPRAPDGFTVTLYAEGLDYPRWIYVLPNGDVLVAEARAKPKPKGKEDDARTHAKDLGHVQSASVGESANRIIFLRDADHDGVPEVQTTFLENLDQPMGMLLLGSTLYVANTDAVVTFPYQTGQTRITAPGHKILDLPAGGWNYHWNRNIIASPRGTKLYVTVGSDSNVMEHGHPEREKRRADILEINPDGSGERVFASGLRNPQGMAFEPESGQLWTAVNERDDLGDELVPDYITSVKDGGFYGWPYAYYGQHEDPRRKGERPDLVARAIAPDYAVGNHTASLGLVFHRGGGFPAPFQAGAFVGQHGSWNRAVLNGYDVLYVPFAQGHPSGPARVFLTGFIADPKTREVYGRPVGVAALADGSLLVADDAGNRVWRVAAKRP